MPTLFGINVAEAKVFDGLKADEAIHKTGKSENAIKIRAMSQRMTYPQIRRCFMVNLDIFANLLPHLGVPKLH